MYICEEGDSNGLIGHFRNLQAPGNCFVINTYTSAMTDEDKNRDPFEVFEGSPWEAGLLKSILEDNDIETIMQQAGALQWSIMPTDRATMKVYVAKDDLEQARAIVEEFYSNMEKEDTIGKDE